MLKNYFLVALRAFRRNKVFSFINIVGLSIGISASLVIYLLVQYDFSFDKFEKDGARIYRVIVHGTNQQWQVAKRLASRTHGRRRQKGGLRPRVRSSHPYPR